MNDEWWIINCHSLLIDKKKKKKKFFFIIWKYIKIF